MIGTRETVRALAGQLALLAAPPRVVGCVLTEPVSEEERLHPVLGSIDELADLQGRHGFGVALVSLPSTSAAEILRVRSALATLGIAERFVVPLSESLGSAPVTNSAGSGTRPGLGFGLGFGPVNVDMAELIGRTPHSIDRAAVARILEGKRVLVTGAGGSIGSELVRIVATFRPEQIVLMERSENALFEIDRQLAERFSSVSRRAMMHDVVDTERTLRRLAETRPHVVFHAAAHKHVPLMEDHPSHAVENNFFGTKSIADASASVGCERFVMISSDKAVNPSSVMGATKRLAEKYVQSLQAAALRDGTVETRFSMVRFGNVLGSACSVLPIWSQQVANGGPVTVTDERMTRYFMTIHEAATLVIQAAAMSGGSGNAAVFVLDMGKPVRVLDLAKRLVAAHGFESVDMGKPVRVLDLAKRLVAAHGFESVVRRAGESHDGEARGRAIEIRLTGARPGEKLFEELAYAAEQLRPTTHPGINSWAGGSSGDGIESECAAKGEVEDEAAAANAMVADLATVRRSGDAEAVVSVLKRYVPTLRAGKTPVISPKLRGVGAAEALETGRSSDDSVRFPNLKQSAA